MDLINSEYVEKLRNMIASPCLHFITGKLESHHQDLLQSFSQTIIFQTLVELPSRRPGDISIECQSISRRGMREGEIGKPGVKHMKKAIDRLCGKDSKRAEHSQS
jgi:hypothetical protein